MKKCSSIIAAVCFILASDLDLFDSQGNNCNYNYSKVDTVVLQREYILIIAIPLNALHDKLQCCEVLFVWSAVKEGIARAASMMNYLCHKR